MPRWTTCFARRAIRSRCGTRRPRGIEDLSKIGLKGSPTVVAKVFAPQPKARKAERIEVHGDAPKDLAATLLAKLFTHHPQLEREISKRLS